MMMMLQIGDRIIQGVICNAIVQLMLRKKGGLFSFKQSIAFKCICNTIVAKVTILCEFPLVYTYESY